MKFVDKYPGAEVRALSWKQPYARAMLYGKEETRSWNTKYRGWVLICSSKISYHNGHVINISGKYSFDMNEKMGVASLPPTFLQKIRMFSNQEELDKYFNKLRKSLIERSTGKALAIGRLFSTRKMDWNDGPTTFVCPYDLHYPSMNERPVKILKDLWIHSYEDVQPIEPFDWKGSQGWKTLDEETKNKIILL